MCSRRPFSIRLTKEEDREVRACAYMYGVRESYQKYPRVVDICARKIWPTLVISASTVGHVNGLMMSI